MKPDLRKGNCNLRNFQECTDIVALLKACANQKDLSKGTRVHDYILERELLEKNCYVASTLINMYAKCGALAKAAQVLEELPVRDVVCWSALVAGYAQEGQGEEALKCFKQMQREGLPPNAVTLTCILKACGSIGAADKGEQVHNEILRQGLLGKDIVLGTALVDMYVKCGALAKAAKVLDELPVRNVVSWSALIAGYTQHGQGEEALKCFERMQHEGLSANSVTLICILKACGTIGAIDKGKQVHNEIVRRGLWGKDIVLGTALVDMYAKCCALAKAAQVLDELPIRSAVSWNALIAGYVHHGHGEDALKCYNLMQRDGLSPNVITFICTLKACGSIGADDEGERIHEQIERQGLLGKDVVLGTTLVDMYVKCGALGKAAQVLDELPVRNVVSWNALIAGYAQQGQGEAALKCLESIQHEGLSPNGVTFTCILKACGSLRAADKGEQIHEEIVRRQLLEKDIVLGNSLVVMYAKRGALTKAALVLEELPVRNTITWSALIAGYAQQRQVEEALKCFKRMQSEGHLPDIVTFICILKACGSIGAVDKGQQIHEEIVRLGLLGTDILLDTTVVDMYAKCGTLAKAQRVLDELPVRDVILWNALIAGYGQQGQGEEALNCFRRMQHEGLYPNTVTLVYVLNACSRSGLLDEAQMNFANMITKFGITPGVEHHACMVDLLGRAGEFDKALEAVKKMPSVDNLPLWRSLLGACRECGNVKLGRLAFENALQTDKNDAAAYALWTSMYTAVGCNTLLKP